ncbi:tyrosine--tRNA ligase, partial [Brevundimonas sp.]|uniref:tyrosine--tRNA ligase n=1 Tax=Brevundimonas sp. TaxID=1871086 RepID=UPI00351672D1
FLEFNYMLMQSVDFLELNRRLNVTLQMGGSDQWGNIVSGVDLVRRVDQKAAFGLTTPLLTTASGGKMGKTAQGAVWLNAEQLSPYDYWQFWRNVDDADVGKFLRLFTDLPLDEIARLEALDGAAINDAKKALADAATTMLHGAAEAEKARARSEAEFEKGQIVSLEIFDFDWAGDEGFTHRSPEALVKAAGISSIKDAKRSISNREIRINGVVVDGTELYNREQVDPEHGAFLVQKGKKTSRLVRPT